MLSHLALTDWHYPDKTGGSEGSQTLYLSACKADAFATLEPLTHKT